MMVDINALARLSRLALNSEEAERMRLDIESILGYMEVINQIESVHEMGIAEHNSVLREDVDPTEPGTYTKRIMALPAEVKDGKVKVRRVLP